MVIIMSVQKDKRRDGKLKLAVLARDHAKYVIQITKNPKIFLPEYNREVTNDLVKEAKDINRYLWAANNVVVNSADDYKERKRYQEKAALTCNILLADMEIAQTIFHLSSKRMRYWTGMVVEIRNRTRAWIESDATRYAKYR